MVVGARRDFRAGVERGRLLSVKVQGWRKIFTAALRQPRWQPPKIPGQRRGAWPHGTGSTGRQ